MENSQGLEDFFVVEAVSWGLGGLVRQTGEHSCVDFGYMWTYLEDGDPLYPMTKKQLEKKRNDDGSTVVINLYAMPWCYIVCLGDANSHQLPFSCSAAVCSLANPFPTVLYASCVHGWFQYMPTMYWPSWGCFLQSSGYPRLSNFCWVLGMAVLSWWFHVSQPCVYLLCLDLIIYDICL